LAYCADDAAVVELVDKELGNTFVHELLYALVELLGAHGIIVLDVLKQFRREAGQAFEVEFLALGECIANLEDLIVGQPDDIARIGFVDGALALRHKLCGRRKSYGLAEAHVLVGVIALKLAAADLAKCDAGAVVGIDIGSNLEDEAGKFGLLGLDDTLFSLRWAWGRGYLDEAVEEFLDSEIVERRAEEYGRDIGGAVSRDVKLGIDTADELEILTQLLRIAFAYVLLQVGGVDVYFNLFSHFLLIRDEEIEIVLVDIVYSLEVHALVDGPGEGAYLNLQLLLNFVEEVEGVFAFAVHLVDEDDDRSLTHAEHGHELACLGLDTLGTIDDDDGGVYGREGSESVFGKVLVAWGVEDVDLVVAVVKLHDRRCHGDTALLLDIHPVARGSLADLVVFDGTGYLYLAAKEEKFFCKCGLTCIWVGYDGKGASSLYFVHGINVVL